MATTPFIASTDRETLRKIAIYAAQDDVEPYEVDHIKDGTDTKARDDDIDNRDTSLVVCVRRAWPVLRGSVSRTSQLKE